MHKKLSIIFEALSCFPLAFGSGLSIRRHIMQLLACDGLWEPLKMEESMGRGMKNLGIFRNIVQCLW